MSAVSEADRNLRRIASFFARNLARSPGAEENMRWRAKIVLPPGRVWHGLPAGDAEMEAVADYARDCFAWADRCGQPIILAPLWTTFVARLDTMLIWTCSTRRDLVGPVGECQSEAHAPLPTLKSLGLDAVPGPRLTIEERTAAIFEKWGPTLKRLSETPAPAADLAAAIEHADAVAAACADTGANLACAREHRQLAAWLRELVVLRAAATAPTTEPQRVPDQPPPVANDQPAVWSVVIERMESFRFEAAIGDSAVTLRLLADMRERDRVGRARYGTPLQPHNNRDALVDGYQEVLDGVAYAQQLVLERPDDTRAAHRLALTLGLAREYAAALVARGDGK